MILNEKCYICDRLMTNAYEKQIIFFDIGGGDAVVSVSLRAGSAHVPG